MGSRGIGNRGTAAVLLAAALGFAALGAQQPAPFRVATELVSIYATVTDKARRLVPDLTKDDFIVLDNGKQQAISFFSNDIQPITVVVMLDRSLSMVDHFELVQDAAREFVKKLLATDRARIGSLSQEIVISPPTFTGDKSRLFGILHSDLQNVGPSPIWTAVDRSITALLHENGRRVVLLFTDGHDQPVRGQVFTDLKDVIHRAVYDEVMVYAIGLTNPAGFSPHRAGGPIRIGGGPGVEPPDPGLKKLAEQSGGGYFELTWNDDLPATFTRVADELHHQYWIGFPPSNLDGKEHAIDLKVQRPGMTVQARKSYIASPLK